MQSNERLHTIPRWPEYHKVNSLFITPNPKISMLICSIQTCTSSTALRMAISPMMIPVCQQHYNTKGPRQPTFLSSCLAAWAPQEEPPLTTCPALVLAWPRLWSKINPITEASWLQQWRTTHWRFRPDEPGCYDFQWTTILVCNWICFVSSNL